MASTVAGSAATAPVPLQATALMSSASGPAVMLPAGGRRRLLFALSKRIDSERRRTSFQPQSLRLSQWRLPRVISGDAEENSNIDENMMDEQTLQSNLETAVKNEDYRLASKIRDRLRALQEDSKVAIISANARFYNAFKNGDLAAMHAIWAKGEHVYVIHPAAGRISGYEMVMGSWEIVCNSDYEYPLLIDLKNVEVHVRGDVGYVCCLEVIKTRGNSWGKQLATNVFERINGQWFICIHHASYIDD